MVEEYTERRSVSQKDLYWITSRQEKVWIFTNIFT